MAEIAVSFLLDQLASFLHEEAALLGGIREEAEYIKDELDRMRAFLTVADAKEETDPELQVWIKQVRSAANDTEDVLDEFYGFLHHHHRHGNVSFYGFLGKISCPIKNLKARHRIASEIRRIKSKVGAISSRYPTFADRYRIALEQSSSSNSNSAPFGGYTWHDRRGDALLLEEAALVEIDKPKQTLLHWLKDGDSRRKTLSVVGMGGSGKTTLVKRVFEDQHVKGGQFQSHAWITVSQSPNIAVLLRDLLQQLHHEIRKSLPQGVETMNNDHLKAVIKEFLHQRRYVIVLDDLWSSDAWHALKYALPDDNNGSRVILTTRNHEIATTSHVESYGHICKMEPLSPEGSWTLFCRKAFQEDECPQYLKQLSESILRKCEGLPLAIVAIGSFLATKDKRIEVWEIVQRSLGDEFQVNNTLNSMSKILTISYNDLPYYLKICWLYMCIFPEDHLISCTQLIRLWIAEGFVQERQGKTLEEVAESYVHYLFDRNLIQVGKLGKARDLKYCRIHDLLREIILSKSTEQNIVNIVTGVCNTRWPEKIRRLAIHNSSGHIQQSRGSKSRPLNRIRSLIVFGGVHSSSLSMLLRSRLLTVLDLSDSSLEVVPNEVFELIHLRYLSLKRTRLKKLPKSIGRLQNLETLDLKHTRVLELPPEILKLRQLRHLLLCHYVVENGHVGFPNVMGFKAPRGIGNLISLQKLTVVEADEIIIREIGRLRQLKSLGITKLRREDGVALCSSIAELTKLVSLAVRSIEEDEIIDLQSLYLARPEIIQKLLLRGYLEKLPTWISSLQSLACLSLWFNRLRDDNLLISLHDLPNLANLSLVGAYEGEKLCFKAGGFQRLKKLYLGRLKGLRSVKVEEGSMPHLEVLFIIKCEFMEEVPSGIQHLSNLQYLDLTNMPKRLIGAITNRDRQNGEYWKVAHIPRVWIGGWAEEDGRWVGDFL